MALGFVALGAARVSRIPAIDGTDGAAPTTAPIIYVCITCRRGGEAGGEPGGEPRPGMLLAEATERAAAGTEVEVRRLRCFANCSRGPSAALRADGSWTYVFGDLDETCGEALVVAARMMADAADGILPWRGRPEQLKRGLIARVPPIDFKETDV
jgi:predicted metal-binding protein